MSQNWIILERVGKWIGLEGEELDNYLEVASQIHNVAINEKASDYDLDSEYYEFLNQEVLKSPELLSEIPMQQISAEQLNALESGEVDFENILNKRHLVDYNLDEIVDFVMLLKLIQEYQNRTDEHLYPLERLHYLVFIVNHRLSQDDDIVRMEDTLGLGNLQRTGYRYLFLKQEEVPHSKSLLQDKNRLQAWGLIEEKVIENHDEFRFPFGISIGDSGEFFFTRFGRQMDRFNSLLLKTWEEEQKKVLQEFATSSNDTIISYLESIDRLHNTGSGNVVLHGRPMNFAEENEERQEEQTHA